MGYRNPAYLVLSCGSFLCPLNTWLRTPLWCLHSKSLSPRHRDFCKLSSKTQTQKLAKLHGRLLLLRSTHPWMLMCSWNEGTLKPLVVIGLRSLCLRYYQGICRAFINIKLMQAWILTRKSPFMLKTAEGWKRG